MVPKSCGGSSGNNDCSVCKDTASLLQEGDYRISAGQRNVLCRRTKQNCLQRLISTTCNRRNYSISRSESRDREGRGEQVDAVLVLQRPRPRWKVSLEKVKNNNRNKYTMKTIIRFHLNLIFHGVQLYRPYVSINCVIMQHEC